MNKEPKNWIAIILATLIVLLLGWSVYTNITLNQQMKDIYKRVDEIESLKVTIPTTLEERITQNFNSSLERSVQELSDLTKAREVEISQNFDSSLGRLVQELSDLTKTKEAEISQNLDSSLAELLQYLNDMTKTREAEISQNFNSALAEQLQYFNDLAKTRETEISQNFNSALAGVVQELSDLTKTKVVGNKVEADKAFALCLEALGEQNYDLAKVYCMSAINHDPSNVKFFEGLAEIREHQSSLDDITALEQMQSIVELGIYQVDSKDILSMIELLGSINADIVTIANTVASENMQSDTASLKLAVNEVREQKINLADFNSYSNEDLQSRFVALSNLTEAVDFMTEADQNYVNKELQNVASMSNYLTIFNSIDTSLNRAENLLATNDAKQLPAINSLIQSANNTLSQSWNLDLESLPQECSSKLAGQAERIAKLEAEYNKLYSEKSMQEIREIQKELSKNLSSRQLYTRKIDLIKEQNSKIIDLLSQITYLEYRKKTEDCLVKNNNLINKYLEDRYKAYQTWALEECNKGVKYYDDGVFDDSDARIVLYNYLIKIDRSLLTSEIAEIYNYILNKCYTEVSGKAMAEFQRNVATATQKKLEEF